MKLDIGSGERKPRGYITLDKDPSLKPDIVADIEVRIPYNDNTFEEVRIKYVLEHIRPENKVKVMAELHRVLRFDGLLYIWVPIAGTVESFQDPSHLSFYNEKTFCYFIKGHKLWKGFHKRYTEYQVPSFVFVKGEYTHPWCYHVILKKI